MNNTSNARARAVLTYAEQTCHTGVRELLAAAYFHEHDGKYIPQFALEEAIRDFNENGKIPDFLVTFLGEKILGAELSPTPPV